jgi:16S rRNA C1402 N4-methylase RsmH
MGLASILQFAREVVESRVKPGDLAVDATVGQGHDTLMLAELVGKDGKVFGFDIQEAAISIARDRVHAKLSEDHSITWVHGSHEFMLSAIPTDWLGQVSAVMFNLGYLPGFDHKVTTNPTSTLAGLNAAVQLLQNGGVITIVAYTGHEGALAEANAVEHWTAQLPQKQFSVLSYSFINQLNHPPKLIVIEKT